MDQQAIRQYMTEHFAGVDMLIGDEGIAQGDTFFFYDPDRALDPARRLPFATIVTKDYGDFDKLSKLDRPDVFRLNIGLTRDMYRSLFAPDSTDYDYSVLDTLLPHPVYAAQSYVCVLNPSEATFERLKPLLDDAYRFAVARHDRQRRSAQG